MSQRRDIRGFVRRVARLPGNSRVRRNEPAVTPTAVSPNRAAAPAAMRRQPTPFRASSPPTSSVTFVLRGAAFASGFGTPESRRPPPPGPFAKVLMSLGREHERRHLERFPNACDLGGLPIGELDSQGVQTIDDLLSGHDVESLAELERPWGKRRKKVGPAAERILASARALAESRPIVLEAPAIPPRLSPLRSGLAGWRATSRRPPSASGPAPARTRARGSASGPSAT